MPNAFMQMNANDESAQFFFQGRLLRVSAEMPLPAATSEDTVWNSLPCYTLTREERQVRRDGHLLPPADSVCFIHFD